MEFNLEAGTGSTFPTCEVADVELLLETRIAAELVPGTVELCFLVAFR